MLVIYGDYEGNLPFTGILREVYGLPYATSTYFQQSYLHFDLFRSNLLSITQRTNFYGPMYVLALE